MKRLILPLLLLLLPLTALATFPTQSATLVRASSQEFTAVGTGTGLGVGANWTVETWVKFTSLGTNGEIMQHNAGGTGGFKVGMQADNSLLVRWWDSGQVHNEDCKTSSTSLFSTGVWYHIGVAITGSSCLITINGVSTGTTVTGSLSAAADTGTVKVGGDNGYFPGQMVLFRYWTTNRTEAQLLANMCTQLGSTSNLGAEWTLNNTLSDNSGNGNTLTNVNSATFSADVPATCATSPSFFHYLFPLF